MGLKSDREVIFESNEPFENVIFHNRIQGPEFDEGKVLTDDYAPVESFFSAVL
jgi:hypothetical protein